MKRIGAFLLCAALNGIPAQANHLSREQVVDALTAHEMRMSGLDTGFDLTILKTKPIEVEAWPTEAIDAQRIRWMSCEDRFRIDTQRYNNHGYELSSIATWNGESWSKRVLNGGMSRIDARPLFDLETDCVNLFNSTGGFSILGVESPSQILRTATSVQTTVEGDRIRYEFPVGANASVVLVIATQPEVCVAEAEMNVRGAPKSDEANVVKMRVHYHVAKWAEYDGFRLPALAYRDAYPTSMKVLETRGVGGRVNRTVLERTDAHIGPIERSHFELQFQDGDLIEDIRLNMRYTHGAQALKVDGREYSTAQPMVADLGGMARTIEPTEAIESSASNNIVATVVGIIVMLAVIILLGLFRSRQASVK